MKFHFFREGLCLAVNRNDEVINLALINLIIGILCSEEARSVYTKQFLQFLT